MIDPHLKTLMRIPPGENPALAHKAAANLAESLDAMSDSELASWNFQNGFLDNDGSLSSPLFHIISHFMSGECRHTLIGACPNNGLTGMGRADLYLTAFPHEMGDYFCSPGTNKFVGALEAKEVLFQVEDDMDWSLEAAIGLLRACVEQDVIPDESQDLWQAVKARHPCDWPQKRASVMAEALSNRSVLSEKRNSPSPIKRASL